MTGQVKAKVWLGSEDSDEYWAEGADATIEVEPTDADEVRIGVVLPDEETDTASIYVSRATADKLARYLAAASVAEVRLSA
jgi:hypothetical protein